MPFLPYLSGTGPVVPFSIIPAYVCNTEVIAGCANAMARSASFAWKMLGLPEIDGLRWWQTESLSADELSEHGESDAADVTQQF